ncbi:hypothetical protein GCM10010276_86770 [Streptomyces longisporus]|uniref:Uncharacterized protein n=1 Tax=Streptomyces longisporus TaxID=1948 RepID=A0ABN3NHP2_STRLO
MQSTVVSLRPVEVAADAPGIPRTLNIEPWTIFVGTERINAPAVRPPAYR